jgi:hypothetical protein
LWWLARMSVKFLMRWSAAALYLELSSGAG